MLSYCLIKKDDAQYVENKSIFPKGEYKDMTLFNIGARDIKMVWADGGFPNFCQIEMKTSAPHRKIDEETENDEHKPDDDTQEKKSTEFNKATGLNIDFASKLGHEARSANIALEEKRKFGIVEFGETLKNSDFCKLSTDDREKRLAEEEVRCGLLKTDKLPVIDHGVTFDNKTEKSRVMKIAIRVPYNKSICPVMEVFMYHFPIGMKTLFACGTYNLYDTLAWFYGIEDDEEYKARWNKFFKINQKKGEDEKDKPVKIKVPKVKAENQLLFMDDLIYELPAAGNFQSKRAQKSKFWSDKEQKEKEEGKEKDDEYKLVNPDLAKKYLASPTANDDDYSDESYEKYYKVISEKLGQDDLANLTDEEKRNVVEELYKRGYFEDWELQEEEADKPQQAIALGQSQIMQPHSIMGIRGTNSVLPQQGLMAGGATYKIGSNLAESQAEEDRKRDEKADEQFNLDLADKPDSEDNKAEVNFFNRSMSNILS